MEEGLPIHQSSTVDPFCTMRWRVLGSVFLLGGDCWQNLQSTHAVKRRLELMHDRIRGATFL